MPSYYFSLFFVFRSEIIEKEPSIYDDYSIYDSHYGYTNGGKAYGSESDYGSDYGAGNGDGCGGAGAGAGAGGGNGGAGVAAGSHRGSEYQVPLIFSKSLLCLRFFVSLFSLQGSKYGGNSTLSRGRH